MGSLQFGAVEAEVACRIESLGGVERLELAFEGEDDSVSGRAWAQYQAMATTSWLTMTFQQGIYWQELMPPS